jgi:hypothetical protein
MRYGSHILGGYEFAPSGSRFAYRVDGLLGLAATNRIPGRSFVSASSAIVLPLYSEARVHPYLFAGGGVSTSRDIRPSWGFSGGVGLRFRIAGLQAFSDLRLQQYAGMPISAGLRYRF